MKTLLRVLVSVLLLGYLLLKLDPAVIGRHLASVSPATIIGAIGLTLCAVAIRAYRWARILAVYQVPLSFRKSFELIQLGNFFGQFLPTTVGGDVIRTWQARKQGLPLKELVHTVLLDRLVGFFSLLVMIAASVPALSKLGLGQAATMSLAIASAAGLVAVIASLTLDRLLARLHPGKIVKQLAEFSTNAQRLVTNAPANLAVLLASFCIHALSIGALTLLAHGVGAHVGYIQMLVLAPPVLLLSMLPFSLAGWGVREGAMMYALGYIGVGQEQAMAISILMGLVLLLVSVTGGLPVLGARSRNVGVEARRPD